MKNILGLDLGTNSIGWALIEKDTDQKNGNILGTGSRIIPMSQDIKDEFGKGNSISQTADRTKFRSVRRLRERHLLRRERLHRVLNVLGFLPKHYADQIDFKKRLGKLVNETEPKLVYDNKNFIFKKSFEAMLSDFNQHQPLLLADGKKVPFDWTIYYLRKKALTEKIEKEELAWLILNFNQKRGYYQLRGEEEEENPNKMVAFHSLKIVEVIADESQKGKAETWYSLILENGWIYRRSSKTPLYDWKGKQRDFIVTTDLNDDGSIKTDKEGLEKRSFRAPVEDDWTLVKKKTEQEINRSHKTVGTYIYENLLQDPKQKIKGKLVRTIEREFYKDELKMILKNQQKFHPELNDEHLYINCVRELYRNNQAHQTILSKKDFVHLFIDDIIFYQRPLRSQKSSISNCTLEFRKYKNENGTDQTDYLKAIPKSHPLFQEFRLWQWIYNLGIYQKEDDTNVTDELIKNIDGYQDLFDFLNNKKEIRQDILIKFLVEQTGLKGKPLSSVVAKYRWNFVEDKIYPCNETGTQIRTRLAKVENTPEDFLTAETEIKLWHIIYSVNDKADYEKALKTFAEKHNLDTHSFVENFKKFPPFKSEYGSFSEKAIKKLLPLIRLGKYWSWENIDKKTQERIEKILTGEFDEAIKSRVRDKAIHLTEEDHFQGLQLWLASYVVYGRHSEADNLDKWHTVADLEDYLAEFRQHSLRNPIVEQVITETLRVVKDIWLQYGQGAKDFFSEIHIELAREMKNTGDERKRLTSLVTDNENTNLRIKVLLSELLNDGNVENVRPYSPMQQEALKIFEDGVLNSDIEIEDDILKISKMAQPTNTELKRYKLWLEQKYRSPYTGQIIPLNRLFTADYEIEHIIPQSRFFDDSFSNKIICESAVNQLKDKQLGLEFIKNHSGTIVKLGMGKTAKILDVESYNEFVKGNYTKNISKRNKLMLEEIPDKMIERQLNDTRYISKFIISALSNIVRSESNDDGFNSKNVLPGNGKITSRLKQDWGMNDIWNELILPRFERMNKITDSAVFTAWNENNQKFLPIVPLEFSKGFQKKRIDHRHHALDALVIAASTREHINLLNNEHAKSDKRFDLNRKLRKFEKVAYNDPKTGKRIEKEVPTIFLKPWETFTVDAKNSLESIIVSFKQNLRVINRATNYSESYNDENGALRLGKDGNPLKEKIKQSKGDSWAIRKPMHKDFVYGKVHLQNVKLPKDKFITAIRKSLDVTFDLKRIETITDTGIQKILKNYLHSKENKVELAFSPEGIEDMNQHIERYNDGKKHQPIHKVRVFEIGSRFSLGESGNKKTKFVEAAKGTNLFFAVYQDDNKGKRNYETIPLNIVIERQKLGLHSVPTEDAKGGKLLFHLSPNDMVYVPTSEELEDNLASVNIKRLNTAQRKRIYKVEKASGVECYFIRQDIAYLIKNYDAKTKIGELESQNKLQTTMTDDRLKITDVCVKLNIDRLGSIAETFLGNQYGASKKT
ncbi:type II CRISPR RNA-guided endonuclease Cas9 [Mucilaginibacter paludis]|uniref:CRISPR-associated endonuclease Cas9 n=1 Tax=Mucilaginibacter paludis DSM 18603 TaxID=714943 RepID=H1YII5_9SPHI|nr:type II CRISPR RNA-guided endonuclease Cas9 [Mucilaginibacter paludis]EHQ26551.1 CRISPR-associated protein, Csn1 family [Mucilaginibacter paludis DSM 18603]